MIIANIIAYILVLIGGLTWGLVGIFNFNIVESIFGIYPAIPTIIIYILVLVATIWLIVSPIITRGRLYLCAEERNKTNN